MAQALPMLLAAPRHRCDGDLDLLADSEYGAACDAVERAGARRLESGPRGVCLVTEVLVSACLLGEPVRYHGGDARCESDVIERWRAEGRLVVVCPETAAGLPVPRSPAEIAGGDGAAVLQGEAVVGDSTGADVTAAFLRGAHLTLAIAVSNHVRVAVFKDGSPSCGTSYVYDGSFCRQRGPGQGVTAALLSQAGIRLFNEQQLSDAAAYIEALEAEAS